MLRTWDMRTWWWFLLGRAGIYFLLAVEKGEDPGCSFYCLARQDFSTLHCLCSYHTVLSDSRLLPVQKTAFNSIFLQFTGEKNHLRDRHCNILKNPLLSTSLTCFFFLSPELCLPSRNKYGQVSDFMNVLVTLSIVKLYLEQPRKLIDLWSFWMANKTSLWSFLRPEWSRNAQICCLATGHKSLWKEIFSNKITEPRD